MLRALSFGAATYGAAAFSETADAIDAPTDGWTTFCKGLELAGRKAVEAADAHDSRSVAKALRYITRELRAQLEWQVELCDPRFPHFVRLDEDSAGPDIPNVDVSYLACRMSATFDYMLRIEGGNFLDAIVQVVDENFTNYDQAALSERGLHPGTDFAIRFSAKPAGNDFHLTTEVTKCFLRIIYKNWDVAEPPRLLIERVGSAGEAPDPITMANLEQRLSGVTDYLTSNPYHWNKIFETMFRKAPVNQVTPPRRQSNSSNAIQYGGGFCQIPQGRALIAEFAVPPAPYWVFTLYTSTFFEPIDIFNRITSLNNDQLHIDSDGKVRIVVGRSDPGVQNWLDCAELDTFVLMYRWLFSKTMGPHPSIRLVSDHDVRVQLPGETPAFGPDQRKAQIVARRLHLGRRYRY